MSVGAAERSFRPTWRTTRAQARTTARNGLVPSKSSRTTMMGTTMMKTRRSRSNDPVKKVRRRSAMLRTAP